MAKKLEEFYEKAQALGKVKACMRMAMLTGIPSSRASSEPDSDANIQRFEAALQALKKEFN